MNLCLPSTPCSLPSTQPAPCPSGLSDEERKHWHQDLEERLTRLAQHPEQGLGFVEETLRQWSLAMQCAVLEKAIQAKADTVEACCPCCQTPLRERKRRVPKTLHAYCGKVRFFRTHGWCPKCQEWCFPADQALGLRSDSTASPLMQEMCALLVSKMPCEQAEPVIARVAGIPVSRCTLAREAQRQGERGIQQRERAMAQAPVPTPPGLDAPPRPFTMVIQIDAWNIRERDGWGQSQALREAGQEPERWHWVYTGTCFRLDQRTVKGKQRPIITERGYVATREGVDALMRQLRSEALHRGLAQAERVLVIADGAVWIWNAVADSFRGPNVEQRLDLQHANGYLWAVAKQLHPSDPKAARAWVKPLLLQVRQDQVAQVIGTLEELKPRLDEAAAKAAEETITYYGNNKERMHYVEGERRGEPVGSGAIESTCHQFQCRMKRGGQFWSKRGDEALLCLEVFWRNHRWEQLFPHVSLTDALQN